MSRIKQVRSALKATLLSRIDARARAVSIPGGVCSISFDDAPASAGTVGARILEDAGMTGTFYLAGSLMQQPGYVDSDLSRALASRGHEIACHTFSHLHLSDTPTAQYVRDTHQNRTYLESLGLDTPVSFSFPFGEITVSGKRELSNCYSSLRSVYPGVNVGRVDMNMLKANSLYSRTVRWSSIERSLDLARRRGGWCVFYTHDVEPSPTAFGCTPGELRRLCELIRRSDIPVVPIGGVARHLA